MAARKAIRTVLAAVADATSGAQVAARKAVELAWLFGADTVLFHACYEPSLSGGAFFDSAQMAAARRDHVAHATRALKGIAAALGSSEREIRVLVEWQRDIPQAVARTATREGADLVVAEPRYRSGRRQRGLSRIDWEVARLCPVPLLLARSAAPYAKPRILAAVDPGGHGLRVSSLDAGIVGLAALMAEATDGSVRVIHCMREPPAALPARLSTQRRERQRVQTMIRHLASGAGLSRRDARVVDGPPVEMLLDAVSGDDADILVMGTVVRGPIRQLLMGSTTEQMVHVAPCDLLLVRPNGVRLGAR